MSNSGQPVSQQIQPIDGMSLRESATLAPGVHLLPGGITIDADDVILDGNGATLIGADREGVGVRVAPGRSNVTIRNLRLRDYYHGIHARASKNLTIAGCGITSTAEVAPNTIFLDIWKKADDAYGGAILLDQVEDSRIEDNDLQHQQNGLLTYHCRRLTVRNNIANYNSGYGIHLFGTCDSLFEGNYADYCSRFNKREAGEGSGGAQAYFYGHQGADATGFLAVEGSSRNVFRRNAARMGGDGFFLAGLSPDGRKVACDDNRFEENDGSLSPNIAFEATFCRGNVFVGNLADRCNYGFWLGFSWDTTIENNRMVFNRQAGIAVENGHGFTVRNNDFQANGHGVLIWTKHVETFATVFPESLTSYDWAIEENTFLRNNRGIRIAADQDHGIRHLPEGPHVGTPETRPRDHRIFRNAIQEGRIGIDLYRADGTLIEGNTLRGNVEASLRQDDAEATVFRNNLGAAGGYL